ncbi:MAG TPA: hypothetical protein VJ001_15740, partial [Rhodocyclaceae bacterium]|nr:hypothetical protein [Rhodocyclaceae bacterium]
MKSYRRSRFENLLSWTARAALILTLSACAGQEAFRRGEELLAKEQWEEAIGHLRQATREDKDN